MKLLLVPPGLQITMLVIGLLCWPWRGVSLSLILLATLSLYWMSTPIGAQWLTRQQTDRFDALVDPASASAGKAIVILGGGRMGPDPEYGNTDQPSFNTLQRLRYGARLAKALKLPVLVSGGNPDGAPEAEAAVMARVLQEDFGVGVTWQERKSNTTRENAIYSAKILRQAGIDTILLVTQAVHMPRAVYVFEQQGLKVIPAGTGWPVLGSAADARRWVPTVRALNRSALALHEQIGLLWYQLRDLHSQQKTTEVAGKR